VEIKTKDGKNRGKVYDDDGKAGLNRDIKKKGLYNKNINRIEARE
jgi:hypothetical protein